MRDFHGVQIEKGWFLSSTKEYKASLRVNTKSLRFDILGGIESKVSKRVFKFDDIL